MLFYFNIYKLDIIIEYLLSEELLSRKRNNVNTFKIGIFWRIRTSKKMTCIVDASKSYQGSYKIQNNL